MIPKFIKNKQIPHKSGVYIYKNALSKVIYVGKAVDLYSRVSSYFNNKSTSPKTRALVYEISNVDFIVVESELEALILEANLIKKYLPIFNIRLTDDKDYLYIAITKEDFPKVITARKKDLPAGRQGLIPVSKWFGPFPAASTVKNTLKQLRKVFPWCQNPPKAGIQSSKLKVKSYKRSCFYYHLGLCPGACVGKISKEEYNLNIKRFAKFLGGQKEELLGELAKEMDNLSKEMKFEEAGRVKKIISGIEYLTQTNRVTKYLENPNFLEDEANQTLKDIQKDLNLPSLPERIEAYDISNIQGKEATGSMVVLTNGQIDKSQYRRFKIKITGKPNDYAMHQEMMGRRLSHLDWGIPQLILVDGGRGQARAVHSVILGSSAAPESKQDSTSLGSPMEQAQRSPASVGPLNDVTKIPIFGIAKRFEWLYPPEGEVIKLSKRSLSLRLLQKIRDESHRFALSYHRKLRKKAFLK